MNLDQQAIGARGNRDARQRRYQVALSGRVTRIGDYRKMRDLLEQRDRAHIEGISAVAVSKVRMPRSQRMTLGFPLSRINCAERNSSAIVADMPRFSRIGRPDRAAASSSA